MNVSKQILMVVSITALSCLTGMASGQLQIQWQTIDNGGGEVSGGNLELQMTLGQYDAAVLNGGNLELQGGFWVTTPGPGVLLGDVNGDGVVNLLDVAPFVDAITNGIYIPEADINQDGVVDLLDVQPFVDILSG